MDRLKEEQIQKFKAIQLQLEEERKKKQKLEKMWNGWGDNIEGCEEYESVEMNMKRLKKRKEPHRKTHRMLLSHQ